jgi:hypothetical protein
VLYNGCIDKKGMSMARQKKETINRTIRFYPEIVEMLDTYADKELISANQAINKLLREKLRELGFTDIAV